ncbi:MAG: N-acetylmuramoyl-L-alanine amidase [Alphaproteobacteria bacterium]|nr:N-acetylmuramoyl-L-alanine amidase [Alphaproteobacteria bacterium]
MVTSPGTVSNLLLGAATELRGPFNDQTHDWRPALARGDRADRHAELIPAEDVVTTRPWETVAEVIADASLVRVSKANLSQDAAATVFTITLSQGLTAEVFTLSNPYRVVIDMPEVAFALPDGTGRSGRGLVREFRYGLFSEDKGRVVLDTTGPVRIDGARMVATSRGVDFEVRLVTISDAEFGKGTGAGRAQPKPTAKAKPRITAPDPKDRLAKISAKPVIVIDPGHGGIDPGAVGVSNLLEKDVVLGVGLALRDVLKRSGNFDVRMTRARDIFLSLDRRVEMSRHHEADLFVSLHADSVSDKGVASAIRGASVYTLSGRASDEQARKMAEKENASDLLAGISSDEDQGASDVRSILIDLMQRETANFSTEFSNVLVRQLRSNVSLSRGPQRSAAFKVLKQTHAPSVLIELGYMSNTEDERLMRTRAWRQKVATSIAKAVGNYFRKRQARR